MITSELRLSYEGGLFLRFAAGMVRSVTSLVRKRIERQDSAATGVSGGQKGRFLCFDIPRAATF